MALRDDILSVLSVKLDSLMNEITSVKQELSNCKEELKASAVRENKLLERISALEKNEPGTVNSNSGNKDDFYVVGSSLLREINDNDLVNGKVKCIRGGQIADVKEDIKSLSFTPKTVITHIGGNDLDKNDKSVENVTSEYALLLSEVRKSFPKLKL